MRDRHGRRPERTAIARVHRRRAAEDADSPCMLEEGGVEGTSLAGTDDPAVSAPWQHVGHEPEATAAKERARRPRLPSSYRQDWAVDMVLYEMERAGRDPARIAASVLLRRAIRNAGAKVRQVGGDGVVCLIGLPSLDWGEVVRDEWGRRLRHGERQIDGGGQRDFHQRGWVGWLPQRRPEPSDRGWQEDTFARYVSQGLHCVGFATDPAWLPADLVEAADFRLTMPLPSGACSRSIAQTLCGDEPCTTLSDEEAALLTPRLFRLARRPGQSADAYLAKLRALVAREHVARKTVSGASPRTEPTLDRLHGMAEAVAWGRQVARDLDTYRQGVIGAEDLDKGCLLSGPPGCGKNLFARALAATCGVPLVTGSYGRWLGTGGGHMGSLLGAMRDTFAAARGRAPCILFIDEVDSFPDRSTLRSDARDWNNQVVNALLEEIDGNEIHSGVLLLAACNHPDGLDPALVRSGRLDRHIRIGLPDPVALEGILREHLVSDLEDASLSRVALMAAGMSGADCERSVRDARRRARDAGREIALGDLEAVISGTDGVVGAEADTWRAAVHEAGHAVAACELAPGGLQVVTLRIGHGGEGATVSALPGRYWLASDVRDRLVFLLAGRAAEEVILHQPSSGAGGDAASDLAQATRTALCAVTAFGLDAVLGLAWSGMPTVSAMRLTDDPVLATRVGQVLDNAYTAAVALLEARLAAVKAVAAGLVERRTLDGAEVAAIVAFHGARTKDGGSGARTHVRKGRAGGISS